MALEFLRASREKKGGHMIPAWSLQQVRAQTYERFGEMRPVSPVRLVGLLFARPKSKLAKEIVSNLDYFHRRSANHVDFFCAGYGRYWGPFGPEDTIEVSADEAPWLFSAEFFEDFRSELSKACPRWRYSGGTELLLLDAKHDVNSRDIELAFSDAVVCDLDRMIADGAILSVERLFESIFAFSETYVGRAPAARFGDLQAVELAGSALKRFVLSLISGKVSEAYKKIENFAV